MNRTFKLRHLVVAFLCGAIFFSGIGYAATASTSINVVFMPIKYFFDGIQKQPPADQKGFIYNGTTYVPLRFVSESLGKKATWEGKTSSVYIGKTQEGTITYMEEMKALTGGKVENLGPFKTNMGTEFVHRVGARSNSSVDITSEYLLNGQYKKFEAYVAPGPVMTEVQKEENLFIKFNIYGDDKLIYSAPAIASDITEPHKVEVDLTGVLRVKFEILAGAHYGNNSSVGLLDAKFISE